jgi:hypothetical protein
VAGWNVLQQRLVLVVHHLKHKNHSLSYHGSIILQNCDIYSVYLIENVKQKGSQSENLWYS